MSAHLRALKARKTALATAAREAMNKAKAESRDLTTEEAAAVDKHLADITGLDVQIEREQALINAEAGIGSGGVEIPAAARISVDNNADKDQKRGFKTFGEFARSVHAAVINPGAARDERLVFNAAAPSTFGNEGVGADGGFLVPPQFGKEVFTLSLTEDSLIPYTDNTVCESNAMVWPQDETTPWGTDGIRAYWTSEGTAGTATKPKLTQASLRMDKLIGLVPMTDELLADASALGSYLGGKLVDTVRWKTNEAIFTGTAAGQLMGVMNSPAIVEVAKESGQTANTVVAANAAKMIARLPPGSYGRSLWVINNEALAQVMLMTLGNVPVYIPASAGMQGAPYGLLMGRPIMVSQHAEAFSSAGDVQLHDFKYYRSLTKAQGAEIATSMHLYFDADATAFRIVFRLAGGPKLKAAITPAKGSSTLSPFVRLGAR